jgi:hypothetical protein
MADVTAQPWYLPDGNYQENMDAFKEYLAGLGKKYSELTDTQKAAVQDFKEDLELMEYKRVKLVNVFLEAKQQAYADLAAQQDAEKIALGQLWQQKEDAGYDVDYTPV